MPSYASPGRTGLQHSGKQKSFRSTDLLATLAAAVKADAAAGRRRGVGGGEARDATNTGLLRRLRGTSFEGELPAGVLDGYHDEVETGDGEVNTPGRRAGHVRGGATGSSGTGTAIKPGSILDGLGLMQPEDRVSSLTVDTGRRSTISAGTGWKMILAASQGLDPRARQPTV